MNKKIDFRVSETTLKALKQRAKSENKPVSQVVRQIIEDNLNLSDNNKELSKRPTKSKEVVRQKETRQKEDKPTIDTKGKTIAQILAEKRAQKKGAFAPLSFDVCFS